MLRLRPETIARLRAAASAMGLSSPDELAERIILAAVPPAKESLARVAAAAREAEDLLDG